MAWHALVGWHSILWTCPPGEKIVYIKTAEKPKKLLILTKRGPSWVLRVLEEAGVVREVASGPGGVQPLSPLALSADGEHCLVGLRSQGGRYSVADCDLVTKRRQDITSLEGAITHSMIDPYSPDGRYLLVHALESANSHKRQLYRVERATGKTQVIHVPGLPKGLSTWTEVFARYTHDGDLAVYNRFTGLVMRGNVKKLKVFGRCRPGFLAYISPDARHVTVVSGSCGEPGEIRVVRYGFQPATEHIIYLDNAPDAGNANVLEFQYAEYSGEMTLNIFHPNKYPLDIDAEGRCHGVHVREYSRLGCGLAIWDVGRAAVVEKRSEGSPERIVLLRL
ncbi:MAG: hypothetical protein K6U00_13185 [Armatimonadetes bacterium]|nr:hypothetical protein [Armatimonadota bacterium]